MVISYDTGGIHSLVIVINAVIYDARFVITMSYVFHLSFQLAFHQLLFQLLFSAPTGF